jgi:FKBP-type peptidyl-prolyl cis-trans isomerase
VRHLTPAASGWPTRGGKLNAAGILELSMRRFLPSVLVLLAACSGGGTPESKPAEPAKAEVKADAKASKAAQEKIPAPPDVAAPPADAQKTASGLAYKVVTQGAGGEKPVTESTVTVHYTGWTTDGEMFDSSVSRGSPAKFPLTRVIKGWTEGLQLMSKGDKFRFWIPVELAYNNAPGKPAGMLVFDVELIDYKSPQPAPADVAAPPADAKKTASGLAYKVLTPGTGTTKPKPTSRVTVHYSGWTTDGKMFDSSLMRDRPATFQLDTMIPGWTEGLQLMTSGEKTRFWIPEAIAYKGQAGKPAGTLVFDVELMSFVDGGAAAAPSVSPGAAPAGAPPGGIAPGGNAPVGGVPTTKPAGH